MLAVNRTFLLRFRLSKATAYDMNSCVYVFEIIAVDFCAPEDQVFGRKI